MEKEETLENEMTDSLKKAIYKYRKTKIHRVSLDFKKKDFDIIEKAAAASNQTKSAYMRNSILEKAYEDTNTIIDNPIESSIRRNAESTNSQKKPSNIDDNDDYNDTDDGVFFHI